MQRAETAQLLTLCAAFDRRTIGETDVMAWTEVLGSATWADAKAVVVEHYSTRREWIMPSDVLVGVRRIRAERIAAEIELVPDADPDDVGGYLAALRTGRHRSADGIRPRDLRLPTLRRA